MVHVFFVITGFALSMKALTAVRARDFVRCYSTLASTALCRPIRLCGPPVVSIVSIVLFIRAGWQWDALPALGLSLGGWGIWPSSWDAKLYPSYDVSLWTIPIELCYSALLFLMVLVLSCMRRKARIAFGLIFLVYCLHYGKWAAAEFVGGMLLAEAHLASVGRESCESLPLVNSAPYLSSLEGKELETFPSNTRRSAIKRMETILQIAALSAALFIAGWPNADSLRTPGIHHLVHIVPRGFDPRDPQGPQKFWFAIAAMGIVWSCGRLTFVRKTVLESRFMQYAGRLSFAMYIVHGPVLNLFQDVVLGVSTQPGRQVGSNGSGLRGWIGINTAFSRTLCWATGLAILFPLVLIVAHLFCLFVNEPLMWLAKKLEIWAVSDLDEGLERENESREHVEDTR